jgi:osmotically inducible protein OsmC
MALDSTASVRWEGDLATGSGTATLASGVAGPLAVDWKARTEDHGGKTSPEELIAAAHASCFSMAFSARLAKAGAESIVIEVEATATFVPGSGITGMTLRVSGDTGLDADRFAELAEDAKQNCPVSQALAGNVPITLEII